MPQKMSNYTKKETFLSVNFFFISLLYRSHAKARAGAPSLSSALIGKLVGLYPVETAIGSGMINNSMGGPGNIAVLSASDRMEMIAFAQMANRLSGAIILILGGLLASILS